MKYVFDLVFLPQTFCVVDIDTGITHNSEDHFCVYSKPQAISVIKFKRLKTFILAKMMKVINH